MGNINQSGTHYWRNMATRISLVVITVVLIVWFLPRGEGRLFHYDEGRPWTYGELIAKFDFPVFKSEEALQAEHDSVIQNFQPYYNKDAAMGTRAVQQFLTAYKDGLPGVPSQYISIIANKLSLFYEQGIMEPQEYATIIKDSTNQIRIVEGK